MSTQKLEIEVIVTSATKYKFTFEHKGTVMNFRNDQIDFPIYHGYPVTRLYRGEVITFISGSEDPGLDATIEIPALQVYCKHVSRMEALLNAELDLEAAEDLYTLFQDLNAVFSDLGSARSSEFGNQRRSLKDRAKNVLGLTSSKLGTLNKFDFDTVKPKTAVRMAKTYLGDRVPKLGWVLVMRMIMDMITYILEHRQEELVEDQEKQLHTTFQEIETRIQKLFGQGFEAMQPPTSTKALPFPEEILGLGESRIAMCTNWSGEWDGRVEWQEDGETVKARVKKFMVFSPPGRIAPKRRLYRGERVKITVMTNQQIADKHYGGEFNGEPDELRVEITIIDAEEYLLTNQRMQELLDTETLQLAEEEELGNLMLRADELHEAILPQRRSALRLKNWHGGIQTAARYKLGITKAIRKTLDLTPETSYEKIWGRVRFYRGKKGEHLDYGKRMELAHLRSLAQTKLDTQDLPLPLQQKLDEVIDMIDEWLAPFEQ